MWTDPYTQWSIQYPEAARALRAITLPPPPPPGQGSEARIQSAVRLEAARRGQYLTRNNKGAGKVLNEKTGTHSFLRWGLANGSKEESDTWASADLIGIYPLLVTPTMVGSVVGQFYSVEVKSENGRTPQAQLNWAALVNSRGGRAVIVNQEGMLP